MRSRRAYLGTLVAVGALGGCTTTDGSEAEESDVVAGPESRLTFDPETITVQVGETVTWYFDSSGHNVCAVPADSELVSIPDSAASFSSYEEAKHRTVPSGETFSHRFEVSGTYEYVCIPHQSSGMVGTVVVE